MIERVHEMVDGDEIRVSRYFRRGPHAPIICQDCGHRQYQDIVHVVAARRHESTRYGVGYIDFANYWLCERCRQHRGRRDWVAPVTESSPEYTAVRQLHEGAVSSSSANATGQR